MPAAVTAENGYSETTDPTVPVNFDTNYFGRGYAPRTYGVTAMYRF